MNINIWEDKWILNIVGGILHIDDRFLHSQVSKVSDLISNGH